MSEPLTREKGATGVSEMKVETSLQVPSEKAAIGVGKTESTSIKSRGRRELLDKRTG